MTNVFQVVSIFFIPFLVTTILIVGLKNKVDVYNRFIEGAREGLKCAVEIVPYIIAIFIVIDLLRYSGALEFFEMIVAPAFDFLGVPRELFTLISMKPISGSGSLAIVENIFEDYGVEGYIARSACAMLGSSETLFFTIAVYYGATAVKHGRHTLIAGVLSYIAGVFASLFFCRFF